MTELRIIPMGSVGKIAVTFGRARVVGMGSPMLIPRPSAAAGNALSLCRHPCCNAALNQMANDEELVKRML